MITKAFFNSILSTSSCKATAFKDPELYDGTLKVPKSQVGDGEREYASGSLPCSSNSPLIKNV